MRRIYRRVETIDQIVTIDRIVVTDDTVERIGKPEGGANVYRVEWFTAEGEPLPESSPIYNFLEAEYLKLLDREDEE